MGASLSTNTLNQYTHTQLLLHRPVISLVALFLYLFSGHIYAENNKGMSQACLRDIPTEDTYLDTTHSYLSSWFCEPANWFDNFFADDRIYEEGHAGSKLRWRNDLIFNEGSPSEFLTTVSASVLLPKVSKRLKLVFDSEEKDDLSDVLPDNTDNAQGSLSFLYDFLDSQKANLSLKLRLSPSITLRYRYTNAINDLLLTRFTQSIYREEGAFGTITRFDIDRTIDKQNALRWTNQAEIIEGKDGLEWLSAFVVFHRINDSSALSYEASITGETRPFDLVTDSRLGIRYRRNFHRSWLFYELVPEVTWPKESITSHRHSVFAFVTRLEIYFEKLKK